MGGRTSEDESPDLDVRSSVDDLCDCPYSLVICPECRGQTDVAQTWMVSGGLARKRTRQCRDHSEHRFMTAERIELGIKLDDVLVRHVGDKTLSDGAFDPKKLRRDVTRGVLDMLTAVQVEDVVDQAVLELTGNLENLARGLSSEERETRPSFAYAISDSQIREAVEQALRLGNHRLAHLLFALSTLGRADRAGRVGFRTAADVLTWIEAEDYSPGLTSQPTTRDEPIKVFWTPPPGRPQGPSRVIKRDRTTNHRYDYDVFLDSIRRAMIGRRNSEETSVMIAKWVLWNLAGQQQVLSSQLGAGVASALRRIDDIAYLRWVATEKGIDEVRDLVIEARALVTTPSPRLVFVDSVVTV